MYANATGLFSLSKAYANSAISNPWILDNGATDHMSSNSYMFKHTKSPTVHSVNLPNDITAPITQTGTVKFSPEMTLQNVLCVPSFRLNLISASKITRDLNCCITLFPDSCILQDLMTGKMIGSGKQHGGLYHMIPNSRSPDHPIHSFQASQSPDLWHMRLGHPSHSRFKTISPLLSLNKNSVDFHNNCSFCHLAKQTRQPFPISSITTKNHFNLLHCDVWGPHKVATHSGSHFFLTIVDDYTRCTWVFLMRHKSETQYLLKKFIQFVHTQFNTSVKFLRTDNGTECQPLKAFLHDHGIELQNTCVYTPQQNGVVNENTITSYYFNPMFP